LTNQPSFKRERASKLTLCRGSISNRESRRVSSRLTGSRLTRQRGRRRAAIAFVSLGLFAAACTRAEPEVAPTPSTRPVADDSQRSVPLPSGATVTIAMKSPEAISALHAITPGALDIAALLNTGLTTRGPNGLAEPALATSWSSTDQRTWIFNLEQGLLFNDGTAITAQSFVDSWQTLATQATRSRNAYLGLEGHIGGWTEVLGGEEGRQIGVRALDDLTFQVQLDTPFPWLPELVAHPAFAPIAASELADPDPLAPVGSGPFKLDGAWVPGETLRLVRVWESQRSGTIATFEFTFTESFDGAAAAVTADRADLAPIGGSQAGGSEVQVVATPTNTLTYLGFPVSREPIDLAETRMALVAAIDRSRIEAASVGEMSASNNAYAPLHAAGANLLTCLACVYDPDRARELLAEVEIPENDLTLYVVSGSAGETWADEIAAAWRNELGWPVTVVRNDLAGLVGFLQAGIPDGPFILEWTSDYPAAESWLVPLFDRAGLDDFTRFSDRDLTRAFDALTAMSSNSPNRATPLKDIRTILAEQVPTIPLGVVTRRVAVRSSVDPTSLGSGQHLQLDRLTLLP